jgi:hypothetical protein
MSVPLSPAATTTFKLAEIAKRRFLTVSDVLSYLAGNNPFNLEEQLRYDKVNVHFLIVETVGEIVGGVYLYVATLEWPLEPRGWTLICPCASCLPLPCVFPRLGPWGATSRVS